MLSTCLEHLRPHQHVGIVIYGPMIYTAPYVMIFMRTNPLRGQVGGGWALDTETCLGPVKWHQPVWRVPFGAHKGLPTGPKKVCPPSWSKVQ